MEECKVTCKHTSMSNMPKNSQYIYIYIWLVCHSRHVSRPVYKRILSWLRSLNISLNFWNAILNLSIFWSSLRNFLQPPLTQDSAVGIAIRYGWAVRGSNSSDGKGLSVLPTCPDRRWGPPSLQHNGCCGSFQGVKRLRFGDDHPPPSRAEVNNYGSYTSSHYSVSSFARRLLPSRLPHVSTYALTQSQT